MREVVGGRVVAVRNEEAGTIYVYGRGVYEGDFPFGDEAAGATVEMARDAGRDVNPRIRLDSGEVVWGAECWWGPEADFEAKLEAARAQGKEVTIVQVSISEDRAQARREYEEAEKTRERFVTAGRRWLLLAGVTGRVRLTGQIYPTVDEKTHKPAIVVGAVLVFDAETEGLIPEVVES